MIQNKKYYWLKLKEDFFTQKEIKRLRRLAGGDTYTIIYLKLLLLSLKNEGKIYFDDVGDNFADELSLEIDEETDNIKMTLSYLQQKGLLELISQDEMFLNEVKTMIGSESESAERVRNYRRKLKQETLQCNETPLLSNNHVTNSNTEIEKEIDKELDKEYIVHLDALWKLYPNKKGKKKAYQKLPKLLKKHGYETLETCIKRYMQYVEDRKKTDFKELKYQNGDTFFNGTYEDYLDDNYTPVEVIKPKDIERPNAGAYRKFDCTGL